MLDRTLALLALFSLGSCAARHAKATTPEKDSGAGAVYIYRASVGSAPAGASKLVVRVHLPSAGPAAGAQTVEAYGVAGNAPFDFGSLLRHGAPSSTNDRVTLSLDHGDSRALSVETASKSVDLSLRLSLPPGVAIDAAALQKELDAGTSATADGRPIEAVATRLERVR